jgi:hypothetical protein
MSETVTESSAAGIRWDLTPIFADADAARAALDLGEDDQVATVLTFGYPATGHTGEKRPVDEWLERADRKPLDELVERI